MALSFRERIMQVFKQRFLDQVGGVDDATITWAVVKRSPLTKTDRDNANVIGIYDTSEKVRQEIGHDIRLLNVVFEFHCKINDAESEVDGVGTIMNAALAEVQRVALLDIYTKEPSGYQLTMDVNERGSELDHGGERPSSVAGVLVVEVKYRTKSNNPLAR